MNEQHVTLDISKAAHAAKVIRIGQGDASGTTIVADVYDNGVALDLTGKGARFLMRLPGGRYYVRDTDCSVSGNHITYVVDEAHAAAVAGITDTAYFDVLVGETVVASTQRFSVEVLRSALDGAAMGESYDTAVEEAIRNANEAAEDAREAAGGTIPLMAANLRGGAKLGSGLTVGADERLSVDTMTSAEVDAAVAAAFA